MSGYTLGFLSYFGVNEFFMVVLVLLAVINVLLSNLSIFENRYFIFCAFPPKPTWEKIRKPWLAAHYIFAVILFIPMAFSLPDQEKTKQKVLETLPCVSDYVHQAKIFTLAEDYTYTVGVLSTLLAFGLLEATIFCTHLEVYIIKNLKSKRISKTTLKLQIKFLVALVIQMVVPSLMLVIPLAYSTVVIIYEYYNQAYMNIVIAIVTTHGLFSTLITIFVHQPYRMALVRMFCSKFSRKDRIESDYRFQPNGAAFTVAT
ncbi:hypothetical protein L3Y34_009373 [Caenorhabditis briggsae]|uniref:Serpentine Receptor, class H n=1 Tax=Caenorhabditis briggsae TaxID=6238 RepID=A0AAE9AC15_CAEBR|nr:hypothetical protein L3Y34_009373 [Caenorhabditis briggsae]